MNSIHLDSTLDARLIREVFARVGRVHVPNVLQSQSALAIHDALAATDAWQLSLNSAGRHFDLSAQQLQLLPPASQVLMVEAVNKNASHGFQYIFNNIPIYDLYVAGKLSDPVLPQVCEFLNSAQFLDCARHATGMQDIAFADAQATWYRPGHFLTQHDDSVEGKNRRAAYVLSLTQRWSVDWGGILQFVDDAGHVVEGYTPKFNALNLLRVPQKHCVSYVTPAAADARYSITGWLRAR